MQGIIKTKTISTFIFYNWIPWANCGKTNAIYEILGQLLWSAQNCRKHRREFGKSICALLMCTFTVCCQADYIAF